MSFALIHLKRKIRLAKPYCLVYILSSQCDLFSGFDAFLVLSSILHSIGKEQLLFCFRRLFFLENLRLCLQPCWTISSGDDLVGHHES